MTTGDSLTKGFPPMRSRGWRIGYLAVMLLVFLMLMVGLDWPSAGASIRDLRQLFPGRRVRIESFHSTGLDRACGAYSVDGAPRGLRYLERSDGMTIERSPGEWDRDAADDGDSTLAAWTRCREHYSRGDWLNFVVEPTVVALLRLG
jgi:hypothetical protein